MECGFVYILTNNHLNVIYVGSRNNLQKRMIRHKHRLVAGFTKKYNVHRLTYFEELGDIASARQRERQLKGLSRAKKDAIIDKINPARIDLFDSLST